MNPKKIPNRVDDLKIVLILQNEMLLMLFCNCVLKQRKDMPRYGKTTNNFFLGTLCPTIFWASCLCKSILMHLSTKVVGK